jgi:hypothetical protein
VLFLCVSKKKSLEWKLIDSLIFKRSEDISFKKIANSHATSPQKNIQQLSFKRQKNPFGPETQLALGLLWQSISSHQSRYSNYFILNLAGVLRWSRAHITSLVLIGVCPEALVCLLFLRISVGYLSLRLKTSICEGKSLILVYNTPPYDFRLTENGVNKPMSDTHIVLLGCTVSNTSFQVSSFLSLNLISILSSVFKNPALPFPQHPLKHDSFPS